MKQKKLTVQIRPSITVDTELLLRLISEKQNTHIGITLEKLLEESHTFKDAQKKLENFSDDF